MAKRNILIIDDDSEAVLSLGRALKAEGLQASLHGASNSENALELLKKTAVQAAVLDLCLDEESGVESGFALLGRIQEADPTCRIIVLTGHGTIEYGVRALKHGAASFLEKPADIGHLKALIEDGVSQSEIKRAFNNMAKETGQAKISSFLIGESQAMQRVAESVLYAAQTAQPVFISGETGTGKGLCALAIHKFGGRADNRFLRFAPHFGNSDLISSELFGHLEGAFTGAVKARQGLLREADKGTAFLDEVDELPLETQIMLLGVLQDKKFRALGSNQEHSIDFRLIAASNQDLEACLESGKLRRDFYHRIAHFIINMPPLRERSEDIELLSEFFMSQLRDAEQVNVFAMDREAVLKLKSYQWPGNVRELAAVIEGAAYRAQFQHRSEIKAADICFASQQGVGQPQSFDQQVNGFKLKLINSALGEFGGNQVRAAEKLGIDRSTLRRILARQ